jgi:hypothetical protein
LRFNRPANRTSSVIAIERCAQGGYRRQRVEDISHCAQTHNQDTQSLNLSEQRSIIARCAGEIEDVPAGAFPAGRGNPFPVADERPALQCGVALVSQGSHAVQAAGACCPSRL